MKEAKAIYMQLRRSMNIDEQTWEVAPKLEEENLREAYRNGEIFNVNDIVENLNTGVIGRIITRGTNYVIVVDEENRVFRNWIKDLMEVHWEIGTDEYRNAVMALTPGQPVVDFTKNKITLNSKKTSKKEWT